jgi:hypothetical protein
MFITSHGGRLDTLKQYPTYGIPAGITDIVLCPQIIAVFGRSGDALDSIAFYYQGPLVIG